MPKVIADIAQRDENVLFLFQFLNTKYKCLLAINAQCLKKTMMLRNRLPVKATGT